jgi:uncharacterized protein YecE (DUF72 family)
MNQASIRFGPAGWSYRDWAGIVYPRPKPRGFDELAYMAGFFDTVEVNATFYRPASPESARAWVERVAGRERFRFAVKLWQRFTHERDTAWSSGELNRVTGPLDVLQEAGLLGALLIQFPWSFRRCEESREWLHDVTTAFAAYPLVLEVRHESWNEPAFFRALAERGIGFVNIDQPLFHDSIAPSARATGRVGYVRVHGRNYAEWWRRDRPPEARYDYLYSPDELAPWAERIREVAAAPAVEEVYVVTNNHFRGKGIANALMLRSMVEGRVVEGPAPLFGEYPEALAAYARPGG